MCSGAILVTSPMPARRKAARPRRVALVLWNGEIGGAETFALTLGQRLRRLGAHPEFVILGRSGPLVRRLSETGLGFHILGFTRGAGVLHHPRRYARAVACSGADGAVLPECSYLGSALRLGGYRGPIVAIEHGAILFPSSRRPRRILDRVNRAAGAWTDDAEVAVSDFVLARMREQPHARLLRRIYNGIEPDTCDLSAESESGDIGTIAAGFVGRLVPGKGLDVLIRAVAQARKHVSVTLAVAGDGSERNRLSAIAQDAGVKDHVQFLGMVDDGKKFWRQCDIAIVPSDTWIESFCMAALEAMACGKPVVATRIGALPEVVLHGVTGTLVPPGDVDALARAIISYARRPSMLRDHASAARSRSVERFHVDDCAKAYLEIIASIRR